MKRNDEKQDKKDRLNDEKKEQRRLRPGETNFYNLQEVADILRITRQTVYTYVWSGRLKAIKIGKEYRVMYEDLDDFLRAGMNR